MVHEILHGIDAQMSAATGLPQGPSLHFLLHNTTDKDKRIPARGFRNAVYNAIGAKVIGAVSEDEQYWSQPRFALPGGATRAEVRLFHQTTSMEYMEFLRDENVTDAKGDEAYQLWEMFGKSAPVEMGRVDLLLADGGTFAPRPLALGKLCSTGGRAELSFVGSTSSSAGGGVINMTGGDPNQIMVLFGGNGQGSVHRANGIVNIVLGTQRYATVVLDGNGEASIPVSFGVADVGRDLTFQAFFRDTADPFGLSMSNGLRVDVTQ